MNQNKEFYSEEIVMDKEYLWVCNNKYWIKFKSLFQI